MKAARPPSRQASSRLHSTHSVRVMGGGGGGWSDEGVGIFFAGGKKKTAEQPVQWRVTSRSSWAICSPTANTGRFL